jgi:hypothetical protein
MTDQWGFASDADQNDFTQTNTDNKGLRGWAEKVNQENKALKDQLAQVQATLHKQQAVNTFEELGLPRSAAALYQGELTPEAINAWATQVRTAFGVAPQAPADQAPPAPPALTPEQQSQMQNFTQAGANAQPSTSIDDFLRGVNNATSTQDLINQAQGWQR